MISRLAITGLALSRGERRLFGGLDMTLASGEAVALTGANGAGKTSLLRAVAGFLRPDAGEIAFHGQDDALEPLDARNRGLHFVGHQDGLKGGRTARDELEFQARWTGGDTIGVTRAADRLGIDRLLDLEVRRLSAGQRRRLALARLVASPRPLWLLDEPMAPLDAAGRALMAEIMSEHLVGGGLVLAAVHDPLPIPARDLRIA